MTLHPNSTVLSLIVRGPFPSCSLVQFILFSYSRSQPELTEGWYIQAPRVFRSTCYQLRRGRFSEFQPHVKNNNNNGTMSTSQISITVAILIIAEISGSAVTSR